MAFPHGRKSPSDSRAFLPGVKPDDEFACYRGLQPAATPKSNSPSLLLLRALAEGHQLCVSGAKVYVEDPVAADALD